jgi:Zn-dependent peptidase ImmA (M78 family)/DNA-binding XRE family transcriptional regulator
MSGVLAQNLVRLRRGRDWSQADTAQRVGISRIAYANLEGGKANPRSETLYALAEALEVPVERLLQEVRPLTNVRFRSNKKLKTREQILCDVERWLRGYSDVEKALGEPRKDTSILRVSIKDPKEAAYAIRRASKISMEEPIRNIVGLLEEHMGIKVLLIPTESDGFFGLSIGERDGGPAIVVNTGDRISVERWIFSAAHELGHLVLHMGAFDVSQQAEEKKEEDEANLFAAHFLMPDDLFNKEWNQRKGATLFDVVMNIKRYLKVSYATVLYRLSENDPDVWRKFYSQYSKRTGKSLIRGTEPSGLKCSDFCSVLASEEPEHLRASDLLQTRLATLVRKAVETKKITMSKAAEVLGLDIAQMREMADLWAA